MRWLRSLLRVYSYTVEAVLSLLALGLSAVIAASPHSDVRIGWLPWTGEVLGAWLAGLGLLGILLVVLAIAGRARFLLMAFALFVLILVTRGLFFSAWRFHGVAEAKQSCWVVLALLAAFAGSIPAARRRDREYRGSGT